MNEWIKQWDSLVWYFPVNTPLLVQTKKSHQEIICRVRSVSFFLHFLSKFYAIPLPLPPSEFPLCAAPAVTVLMSAAAFA